jgi:hypothetical protein
MNKIFIGGLVVVAILLFLAVWVFGYGVSIYNQEKSLRADFEAKQKDVGLTYDNMWKSIQQKYQVKGDYARDFKEVVSEAVKGRQGGSLLKSVQESLPGLDASVYKDVMATIEGKRDFLQRTQQVLLDIAATHTKLRTQFPSSLVVGSVGILEPKLIQSSRTEKVMESGKDDTVKLED